jgi:hypothetical protein
MKTRPYDGFFYDLFWLQRATTVRYSKIRPARQLKQS